MTTKCLNPWKRYKLPNNSCLVFIDYVTLSNCTFHFCILNISIQIPLFVNAKQLWIGKILVYVVLNSNTTILYSPKSICTFLIKYKCTD